MLQYFYNSQTSQFLYWDAEKSTYLPAPTTDDGGKDDGTEKGGKKDKEKREKVKIAKRIAKVCLARCLLDTPAWCSTLHLITIHL